MNELNDLQHFLKLALAQVRHRLSQSADPANNATEKPTTNQTRQKALLLLEDLIKEQLEQT